MHMGGDRSVEWYLVVGSTSVVVGSAGRTAVGYTAGHGHTASAGAGVGTAEKGGTPAVVQSYRSRYKI